MASKVLTKKDKLFFESQGYLKIEVALSLQELTSIRKAGKKAEKIWRNDKNRLGICNKTLEQIQAPIEYDDIFLNLLWHPRIFPMARELLGDDISMIDNDYFITPPHTPKTHAHWHHDVGLTGVYHPSSILMVKVFYLLSDVNPDSGGTLLIPGSHKFPMDHQFPVVDNPKDMPGAIQMTGKAGTVYLFNGRIYHAASNNDSDNPRHVLIYNYGHFWMKIWTGYEPSKRIIQLAKKSRDPVKMQLLGIGDAYNTRLSD